MLLNFDELFTRHRLKIRGVLHVGGHTGEEAPTYHGHQIRKVIWVEAEPGVERKLNRRVRRYGQESICALITDVDGVERDFHVTNEDSLSSSVFEFGTHAETSPNMVVKRTMRLATRTVDSLLADDPRGFRTINFLNMDIQGAELLALRGARKFLEQVDYVMTEINIQQVYKGCAQLEELDAFLRPYGLLRVETFLTDDGWGDAFYIKREGPLP